jgi:hypothetical protein
MTAQKLAARATEHGRYGSDRHHLDTNTASSEQGCDTFGWNMMCSFLVTQDGTRTGSRRVKVLERKEKGESVVVDEKDRRCRRHKKKK